MTVTGLDIKKILDRNKINNTGFELISDNVRPTGKPGIKFVDYLIKDITTDEMFVLESAWNKLNNIHGWSEFDDDELVELIDYSKIDIEFIY